MSLKRFLTVDLSDNAIIKLIASKIAEENFTSYSEIKKFLKDKYNEKSTKELEEKYLSHKYKKKALESMNLENIQISSISVIPIFLTLITSIAANNQVHAVYIKIAAVIYVLITCILVLLVKEIIYKKAINIIYCKLAMEVIEEILNERNETKVQIEEPKSIV
ncbi:MAG TPA: hypothetical protein GXX37_11805 [Clostridiaceae bacterium]|nr:hypothetical protein [Clostridiaceae bacterium]